MRRVLAAIAVLAALGAAESAAAVAACVRVRGEVEPEPGWIAPYAEGRERFRALYPAIRSVG